MARSWRNFFRRSTDEEKGPVVTSEPERSADVDNGHVPDDLEQAEVEASVQEAAEDVPKAEEVQAQRKDPTAAETWEVEEPAPGEVE